MKVMMKFLITTTLSLLAFGAYADTQPSKLDGSYKCQRSDGVSSPKTYPITVTKTGDTYTFQWTNDNGYPAIYGTGIMTKTMDNVISVVFWDAKDKESYGNEIFQVKPDGSLNGVWTMQSDTKTGTETCTKS